MRAGADEQGGRTRRARGAAAARHGDGRQDLVDIEARLRAALRTEMPAELRVGPDFADVVRRRHQRRRARLRASGLTALAVVVVLGLVVPTGLLLGGGSGDGRAIQPAATPTPGNLWSYGGVTVTWLPAGMVHDVDSNRLDTISYGAGTAEAPSRTGTTIHAPAQADPNLTYLSTFVRTGQPSPATLTVIAFWAPSIPDGLDRRQWMETDLERAMRNAGLEPAPARVHGQTAFLVTRYDPATATQAGASSPPHAAYLVWRTTGSDGNPVQLMVVLDGVAPVDVSEVQGVAEGIVVGTRPGGVDQATGEAVIAAFRDVYERPASTPEERAASAVEDGASLAAVRRQVAERYPRLTETLDVTVNLMLRLDSDTIRVDFTLSFIDPTVPGASTQRYTVRQSGRAVFRDGRWRVSRDTYCAGVGLLQLACP